MLARPIKSPIAIALVGFSLLGAPFAARAAVGATELTFTGEVNTSTCEFKQASTVTPLDKISAQDFTGGSKATGRKQLKIEVSNCGATPVPLKLNFEVDVTKADITTGRLKLDQVTPGTSDDLELQFLDDKGQIINLFNNSQTDTVTSDSSGDAHFDYQVEYFTDSGTVTAGARTATLKATLAYP